MRIFNKKTWLSLALVAPLCADAQVVNFPMEVSTSGATQESVSKQSFMVKGALAPVCVPGAKGKAWRLDGYSSYLNAQIDPTKFDGQSQVTLSLWVAPESYPMMGIDANGEWFTTMAGNLKMSDTNNPEGSDKGFAFQLGSRGTYAFFGHVRGWKISLTANEKLPRYQWNHLVVTIDGINKAVVMYNNGKQVARANCQKGTFNGGGTDFYVGKSYTDLKSDVFYLNTFNGLIDDFTIYTGIRTDILNETPENAPVLTYSADRYANDILRPAFHGMPSAGWTNETHGAVFYNGKYHVFFQKNPNGPYMARLNWGHIVSDNLCVWEEEPTAISPEEWYDQRGCWSGCIFTDKELTGGKPNIFYTGVDYARAMISQAKPLDDDLLTWQKADNNPIVNGRPNGLSDDFRDCYVFRNGENVYMIVGTSKDGVGATTLHRYDKATGTWSNDGSIFFSGTNASLVGTFWEMPNVTKIGDKWLFTTTPLGTSRGVRTLYWTGSINADGTFSPDSNTPKMLEISGFSKDGYGLLSPTIFQKDDKTLLLGIVPDKLSAEENYKMGYAHTYSLPREISLDAKGNLVQKPFSGLTALRTTTSYCKSNFTLSGSQDLSPVEGRTLELSATFVAGAGDLGFTFLGTDSKKVTLTYSTVKNTVKLDMSGINRIYHDASFNGIYESALTTSVPAGQEAKLTVYVDHSIVDIFVNDTYSASVRLFPRDVDGIKATAFSTGQVTVNSLQAYVLDDSPATGISQVQANHANKVYASNGSIHYELSATDCTIRVYDVAGRCLDSASSLSGEGQLALTGRGVRIVKVWDASHAAIGTYKVIL